jgi:ABC-type hemin transport system substrate-binding protein
VIPKRLSSMMRRDRLDGILGFAQTPASEENRMSIFPTKFLLASDGSREAELAARTAADLANSTNSE